MTSPSSGNWTQRVSARKAARFEARKFSPSHLAAFLAETRCEEGREVRGEEVLALAEADDERRLAAHADEQVGMVVVDRDDREVALELRVDAAQRLGELALVLALEQVDDHLGVGLRVEGVAGDDQLLPELAVVLDDPVEDDCDLAGVTAGERMRVLRVDGAVRGPARVPQPVPGRRTVGA